MNSPAESSLPGKRREPRSGSVRERSRAPKQQRKGAPLVWVGLGVLAIAAVVGLKYLVDVVTAVETSIRVLDAGGKPVGKCKLEFFAYDDSASAPARPRKLGELLSDKSDPIQASEKLVPGYALVKVTTEGFGVASFLVQKGAHPENQVKLKPAVPISGVVQDETGRTLGGGRIEAVGSGDMGLVLATTTSAADGTFKLDGISPTMHHVALRIHQEGHALVDRLEYTFDNPADLVCKLAPTELVTGRVVTPKELSPKGLVVQTLALPGIATEVHDDGKFVLDHIPRKLEPKLIIVNLPTGYTHWSAAAHPGQEVEIRVTRSAQISGTVVDERSGQIPHMAIVRHDHGPRGQESFRLDEFGRFFLFNVPEGEVTIEAFSGIRREEGSPYAAIVLKFEAGENKQDVAIKLK